MHHIEAEYHGHRKHRLLMFALVVVKCSHAAGLKAFKAALFEEHAAGLKPPDPDLPTN